MKNKLDITQAIREEYCDANNLDNFGDDWNPAKYADWLESKLVEYINKLQDEKNGNKQNL